MSEPVDTPVQEPFAEATSDVLSKVKAYFSDLIAKVQSKEFMDQVYWSVGSVLLALVVAAVIMLMAGYNPGVAFVWLSYGALTKLDQVLWYASPLILTGLSVAIAFRCGLFNIGAEGQLFMGSMASALLAYLFAFPILVHPLLCLAVGVLAGAGWGFLAGLLKAYRGAHEVVTTMMLSYIAILFTSWLVSQNGPFWDGSMVPRTPQFYDTALLPVLFGNYLHFGFIIALMAVFGVHYLINKTVLGYEMRAVGHNIDAAEYAGIDSKKKVAIALGISGGLSGLAGSTEIIGTFDRFTAKWSAGLGWDGITVAVLGNNNPFGVLVAALFFGALKAGGNTMQVIAHVPVEMIKVIQGLVVLFVAAPRIISWLMDHTETAKDAVEKEPAKALPWLLAAIFGLASVFLSLGTARTIMILPAFTPMAMVSAVILILVAFTGVLIFITELSQDPRGSSLLLIIAVGWLEAGIAFLIGSGTMEPTVFLMSAIAFLFWFTIQFLAKRTMKEGEG
ncbi:MAG: ABC transporter permease [Candidatus Thorarchaeota archaeon]